MGVRFSLDPEWVSVPVLWLHHLSEQQSVDTQDLYWNHLVEEPCSRAPVM